MIKLLIPCAGAALALPCAAQVAAPDSAGMSMARNPDRRICHRIDQTSSRIPSRTICKSARDWEEESQEQRDAIERAQRAVNPQPGKPMAPTRPGCC